MESKEFFEFMDKLLIERDKTPHCDFDAALGGNAHWAACPRAPYARVRVRNENEIITACREHLYVYVGNYITEVISIDHEIHLFMFKDVANVDVIIWRTINEEEM